MATSSKFDITSSSPDRPLYIGGQRGSHIAAQLDRSSSFRENMDNPILSSLPNMSRSTSSSTQGDLMSFFHCMRFDPKVVAAEHKSLRQGDFKRHVNAALGLMPDESPSASSKGKMTQSPAAEEVKRVKAVLRESSVKARERVKIFNEALSVFNKFFPTVPSKKRSRPEGFPGDRSGSLLSSDRSSLGPNMGKIGVQNHSLPGSFEIEQHKSEERTKASLPNKRTRTSFVDAKMEGRNNALMRQSGTVDRDREMARLANSGAVQGEDRNLSIGVDGWEKSKMKKKRSVIKPEISPSTVPTKPNDGYREAKQGMQHRPASDSRSRLNNDSHGFRPGVSGSIVGAGKSDGMLAQSSSGMRSSTPRADPDSSPVMNDKRDRPIASDKERVNLRAVNKVNSRDESNSASPVSNPKASPSVRGPRSGTGSLPKSSPASHRSPVSNDWEINACTNKPPSGVNNRKRMTSARSSSPPVANWAGQRPQKISRTARRSNLLPIVTNTEENSPSDVTSNDNVGFGFGKRISSNSPKMKGEPLSESEESGAAEIKPTREKVKKCDDVDEKGQKMSNLVISSRKNKLSSGEDLGDGVRRQGRTGRGFASTRSLMPMTVDKIGPVGTAKQLRSARHGIEKSESKAGRPPSRKLSDRKAYTRQKHTAISGGSDFLVGSDNVHDELLAAANAVANPALACSSQFWKQMEPLFGPISDSDITCLKQQGNIDSTTLTPNPAPSSGFGLSDGELMTDESLLEDQNEIPLSQRLLAALITEEDYNCASEDLKGDIYGSEFDSNLDEEFGLNSLDPQSLPNFPFSGHSGYNGHTVLGKPEQYQPETDMNSNFRTMNGLSSDQAFTPTKAVSDIEYANMSMNERLLLELQSVGIFPEEPMTSVKPGNPQLGDEEISDEISKYEAQYLEQAAKKKSLIDGILKAAEETKENQEKEFEQRALEKLTTMAYEKYTACWGSSSGGKGSSNKMAKQSAFAFVKRTLDHVHKYEETGVCCFSDPLFKDIFNSRINANGARQAESATDGESSKGYSSIRYLEGKISASQQSPSPFGQNVDNNDVSPENLISEQATGKEDTWSDRVKKRELSLDDVIGYNMNNTPNAPPSMGGSLSSSAKGKRSERDRDGKTHNREVSSRNGTAKLGRPSLTNAKGERKNKSKPKQKTQSVSVNGLLGKMSVDQHKPALTSVSKSNELTNSGSKDEFGIDGLDDPESMDLSHLQIPGMDVLGAPDDLDGQSQDLGSWLNIDDEGLQDHDFMGGLEIPMDDLADLNMMV